MPVTIKCHKKAGLHPLPRKMQFWKNHRGGGGQIDLPSPLGLRTAVKLFHEFSKTLLYSHKHYYKNAVINSTQNADIYRYSQSN